MFGTTSQLLEGREGKEGTPKGWFTPMFEILKNSLTAIKSHMRFVIRLPFSCIYLEKACIRRLDHIHRHSGQFSLAACT